MFDLLARMRADLAVVATEQRAGWSAAAQCDRVRELAELRDRVDAELVRAVAQWDGERGWELDGRTPANWLAHHTPLTRTDVNGLVRAARLVREHEATRAALADGSLTAAKLDRITVGTRQREEVYAEREQSLLDAAATLDLADFTVVTRRWRDLADDAVANQDAYALQERRFLHTSKTLLAALEASTQSIPTTAHPTAAPARSATPTSCSSRAPTSTAVQGRRRAAFPGRPWSSTSGCSCTGEAAQRRSSCSRRAVSSSGWGPWARAPRGG
jgi:hypothetical protein